MTRVNMKDDRIVGMVFITTTESKHAQNVDLWNKESI